MAPVRKILIADPDPESARLLGPALRQRGHQVHVARDGSRALQLAILRLPDLILLDERAPLLDARTFVRILRTNPRTERIPVLLTGETDDPERARHQAFLRKPFRLDEVLGRVEQILRKAEAPRGTGEAAELEGNLAQLPLTDLLQILAVNQRSGRLVVEREGEQAEVQLREGRVVDARFGPVGAEKALWRLLTRREGLFSFSPGTPPGPDRITRRLDDLILEGLRQADELARLLPLVPARRDLVELAVDPARLPEPVAPVVAELVALLSRPRKAAELIDRCHASDLDATRALVGMLERGQVVRLEGAADEPGTVALLAPHELHALRTRVARGRTSGHRTIGKVLVVGGGPLSRQAALARFATVPGFTAMTTGHDRFGTVGRLSLGGGVRVDVLELPGEPEQRPLWRHFASGAVGVLVLLPADADQLLAELAGELNLPVVVCGPAGAEPPPSLHDGLPGVTFAGSDAAEALRALLAGAAARGADTDSVITD